MQTSTLNIALQTVDEAVLTGCNASRAYCLGAFEAHVLDIHHRPQYVATRDTAICAMRLNAVRLAFGLKLDADRRGAAMTTAPR